MIKKKTNKCWDPQRVRFFYEVFLDMDNNKDGHVTFEEFRETADRRRSVLKSSQEDRLHREILNRLFRQVFALIDVNKSGDITFEELLRLGFPSATKDERRAMYELIFPKPPPAPAPRPASLTAERHEELEALFRLYDTDANGLISYEEFREASLNIPGLSRDDARRLMEEMDLNGDSVIDLPEFITGMRSMYDTPV